MNNTKSEIRSALFVNVHSAVNVNKLAPAFDVIIREFSDLHVIKSLERESWARGYNNDSGDDDRAHGFYCDDPVFLKELAAAAICDESRATTSTAQLLAEFMIGGGFDYTVSAELARVIGRAYEVTLHFAGDWAAFDWDGAAAALGFGPSDDDDEVFNAVVCLLDEVPTIRG